MKGPGNPPGSHPGRRLNPSSARRLSKKFFSFKSIGICPEMGPVQRSASHDVGECLAAQIDAQALQGEIVDFTTHRLQAFLANQRHQPAAQGKEFR